MRVHAEVILDALNVVEQGVSTESLNYADFVCVRFSPSDWFQECAKRVGNAKFQN